MKQLFLASTYFQVVCLAAGIDAGEYDNAPRLDLGDTVLDFPERPAVSERILVLSNNAQVTELSPDLDTVESLGTVLGSFDRIVRLNDVLAPNHPSAWRPQSDDLPIWERLLRSYWDLGTEELELVLESPQVNPAIALGRVFRDALIRVHSDGLMSYGPTRNKIPLGNGQRITTLHYLPLVTGVRPRLLHEFRAVPQPLPVGAFLDKVALVTDAVRDELAPLEPHRGNRTALAVGQYLAALGLLSPQEEEDLHRSMIVEAASRGFDTLVFKPHPAAPPAAIEPLHHAAREAGIRLTVFSSPVIAETLFEFLDPGLVIGGFSTALATARSFYGIPALAVGTDLVLERIAPFQNSNRIPATLMSAIADGTAERIDEDRAAQLQLLVDAVGYAMLPEIVPDFRDRAVAFLEEARGTSDMRYFKKKRLTALGLPGAPSGRSSLRRSVRRAGRVGLGYSRIRAREIRTSVKARLS